MPTQQPEGYFVDDEAPDHKSCLWYSGAERRLDCYDDGIVSSLNTNHVWCEFADIPQQQKIIKNVARCLAISRSLCPFHGNLLCETYYGQFEELVTYASGQTCGYSTEALIVRMYKLQLWYILVTLQQTLVVIAFSEARRGVTTIARSTMAASI